MSIGKHHGVQDAAIKVLPDAFANDTTDCEGCVMRSVTSHVTQAYRSSPFRGNRVAPMRRGSWPNELFSRRFDRRTLRMTDIAAGTVVTAPTAISAAPIARRRSAVNRSDISKPIPTPSAARVVTMNPNVGRSSRTFFIATPWSNGGWRKPAAKQGRWRWRPAFGLSASFANHVPEHDVEPKPQGWTLMHDLPWPSCSPRPLPEVTLLRRMLTDFTTRGVRHAPDDRRAEGVTAMASDSPPPSVL